MHGDPSALHVDQRHAGTGFWPKVLPRLPDHHPRTASDPRASVLEWDPTTTTSCGPGETKRKTAVNVFVPSSCSCRHRVRAVDIGRCSGAE
jgi:hypothetical protein